ncbi:molybdate ABC transporter substrate-binding protein [Chryseolinea sp. H1M3-3]|uniref:molybdate ABC transporter substrate-binding protein n=1 Tax=Chryseolinea sp. H1M3-3 TaxID=3034144 RepID=UPI0023EC74BE|nr:molybdate ABC transporter substrate-binding protein [Chryseolinea sp. H1M3-3]
MKKLIFLIFVIWSAVLTYAQPSEKILIAAASDLKFAMDSIVLVFKKEHPGIDINVTYGSSGKLYEQISHSAPFDFFFSADNEYPISLKKNGFTISEVYPYGIGRIVIWSKQFDPNRTGINILLDKDVLKISMANPKHAPYGKRAEEALKFYKVYEGVSSKLVYGENISQAAQFVTAGAADIGIIALSLALSPTMKKHIGHYYVIPEASHRRLEQGFVMLKHAEHNSLAPMFRDFVLSKQATDILSYFGFAKINKGGS